MTPGPAQAKPAVLVIDDEPDIVAMMTDILVSAGAHVLSAGKVTQGLTMAANQKFDLIIVDMQLPQGSGSQFVHVLRRDTHHLNHKSPIVVVSGNLTLEIVKELKALINGALTKPFSRAELLERLNALVPSLKKEGASEEV